MRVALFITCLSDSFFPQVGAAVVRVLRHYGCSVEFPEEQTCCGQPLYNSGQRADAAALARRFVNVFSGYDAIVTPSASCAALVRLHLPDLLNHEATARRVAACTWELTTFLTEQLGIDLGRALRLREPTTFHFPCHARELCRAGNLAGWLSAGGPEHFRPPARPELCCGFGGLFGAEFPEVSGGMVTDKLDDLQLSGAARVVCNEGGCTLQLAGGAQRQGRALRFVHIAELLAESLGLTPAEPSLQTEPRP